MSTYKNKRLHISLLEFIVAVIVIFTSFVGTFMYKEYSDTRALFNIGKTFVDYVITAPSKEQVSELQQQEGIDSVVPYIYRSVKYEHQGKKYESSLYIIEDAEDTQYTPFSNELLIAGEISDELNSICISNEIADNSGVEVGDVISVNVQNQYIDFAVAGIYESDYRSVGGMMLAELNGDLEQLIGSEYKYSGAYLGSNNTSMTDDYVEKYVPLGDLRTREEFDSDEAYDIYLKDRETSDYSKMIFYTENYLKEVEKRNEGKAERQIIIAILLYLVSALIPVICSVAKASAYIRKDLLRDIRNNYTVKQECSMFGKFFMCVLVITLFAEIIGVLFGSVMLKTSPSLLVSGIVVLGTTVAILVGNKATQRKIRNNYAEIKQKLKDKD